MIRSDVRVSDTGEAGNIRRWGLYDNDDGLFFRLNGDNFEFVLLRDGSETVINASDFDIPFEIDDKLHKYVFQYTFDSEEVVIFIDDKFKHIVEWKGVQDNTKFKTPDLFLQCQNKNNSSVSSDHTLFVSAMTQFVEGVLASANESEQINEFQGFQKSTSGIIAIGSQAETPIIAVRLSPTNFKDKRRLIIKSIHAGFDKSGWLVLRKNVDITGGSVTYPEKPVNPSFTPTTSLTGNPAILDGYSDGDSVSYKISKFGSRGETLPSAGSASISVSSPKEEVLINWESSNFVFAWGVYREINGSGIYNRIAILPAEQTSFIDIGYQSASETPASSDTAIGDSFAELVSNHTFSGGERIFAIRIDINRSDKQNFNDKIVIGPGENLSIHTEGSNNNVVAGFEWEEEVY